MIGERDDFDIHCDLMQRLIDEQPTLDQAMNYALEAVKPGISERAYKTISATNYSAVLDRSRKWMQLVLRSDPPPQSLCAFYFGLFDTHGRFDHKNEWQQLYISGADQFDPDDEGEWACDPLWMPKNRYPRIRLMKLFGKLCPYKENQAGFTLSSSFAAALAMDHASMITEKTGFGSVDEYPIASGHDAGDIHILGYMTPNGLRRPS